MKGHRHNWYSPAQQREQERRRELERKADEILRADRRRRPSKPDRKPALSSALPQRLSLDDLPLLRKLGRVP
ncbi:MAG TPA: hypothetical protein VGZ89_00920 [Xanthobacteraceae bacterium]|jgi:hypothetical protein|nr:hypothetical protein [Xanthobacteraceae bacterium]